MFLFVGVFQAETADFLFAAASFVVSEPGNGGARAFGRNLCGEEDERGLSEKRR